MDALSAIEAMFHFLGLAAPFDDANFEIERLLVGNFFEL